MIEVRTSGQLGAAYTVIDYYSSLAPLFPGNRSLVKALLPGSHHPEGQPMPSAELRRFRVGGLEEVTKGPNPSALVDPSLDRVYSLSIGRKKDTAILDGSVRIPHQTAK